MQVTNEHVHMLAASDGKMRLFFRICLGRIANGFLSYNVIKTTSNITPPQNKPKPTSLSWPVFAR